MGKNYSDIPALSGYTLTETLREDEEFILLRGKRKSDGFRVLIEILVSEAASPERVTQLEREYALKEVLDPAWAVQPIGQVRSKGPPAFLFADPGGETLARIFEKPLEFGSALQVAIGLTGALENLHKTNIIHKDIKPANFLVDIASGTVRLMGFGIASRLLRERQEPGPPEVIAGTLAYMAPEQTGRMNRSVDSRSDLYSLGITLYEMFTGALPFTAHDPLEWVHGHIARQPTPPAERNEGIPSQVSDIVMKLLAKTPELRYQTAAGVKADLERCRLEWAANRRISPFPVGRHDASSSLRIPEKLYGRERESKSLHDAYATVVATGTPELVVVSGYSGIGKSALVNELCRAIVLPRGLFASGKFNKYKTNAPFDSLAQAFRDLVRQVLAKGEQEVTSWREAMLAAVGQNGRILVDIIPELEIIIGKQPPIQELSSQEALNLLHAVFRKFVGVFANKEHPLVLFLDDLQWQDAASLKLLEHLITHPEVRYFLLIGAYRDNEVDAFHPLMPILDNIRKTGAIVHDLVLKPLSVENVGRLLADAFHCGWVRAEPLAQLVHEKTAGNPFFVIQFLSALVEAGLAEFDNGAGEWKWDLDRIQAKNFTDNVVELMIGKLKRLPATTLEALTQIACLGNSTDFATLARVHGKSEEQTEADLWPAVVAGFVLPKGNEYAFVHDRIQEAAYSFIPEANRAREHLRIGRLLISGMDANFIEGECFALLNQFNRGISLVTDQGERDMLRRLNFLAGRKAKASVAYASARDYLAQAMLLMPPGHWEQLYSDSLTLFLELSECEFLAGNHARAEELFGLTLSHARTNPDRAEVHLLRVKLLQMVGNHGLALESALEGLRCFGISFPESQGEIQAAIKSEHEEIKAYLKNRSIADIAEIPPTSDPDEVAILGLLTVACPTTFMARPQFFPLLALKAVTLSLRFGNIKESCLTYSYYGYALASVFDDHASAFDFFTRVSLPLLEKFKHVKNPVSKGPLLVTFATSINFWKKHFTTSRSLLESAYIECISVGDFVFAGYASIGYTWQLLEEGLAFEKVRQSLETHLAFASQSHGEIVHRVIRQYERFLACLQGLARDTMGFDGDGFSEAECLAFFDKAGFVTGIGYHHVLKQVLAFSFGRFHESLEYASQAEAMAIVFKTQVPESIQLFYHALAFAALYADAPEAKQAEYFRKLKELLVTLKFWAESCLENFLNRYNLVAGEVARIERRDLDAMRLYDEAIASARENGFIQYESLANEIAARFYLDRGYEKNAYGYLRDARSGYFRWGAHGKVKQLDRLYPGIQAQTVLGGSATIGTTLEQLDMMSVIKATQAVSGEIVLGALVEKLLAIMVEHAGAEKGLLIFVQEGEHILEAEAATKHDGIDVHFRHTAVTAEDLPESVLHIVLRTKERIILDDASAPNPYSEDNYIRVNQPRSVLCLPLVKQGTLVAILYLENNLTPHAFTPGKIAVLDVLASQAAISLENSRLYDSLQKENADRKRAEERFSKVFQESPMPMLISRVNDHRLVDANAELLESFGFTREELLGHTAIELGMVDNTKLDVILKQLSEQGFIRNQEIEVKRKSGEVMALLFSVVNIELGGEKCQLTSYVNITQRKLVEEQLLQSQKMDAIGRLAGGVAHDFNNLLTAINGYSTLILEGMEPANPNYSFLREILKAGERAATLTRQLLAHSRKQVLQPKAWDINVIVKEIVPMLMRLIGEDVHLEMDLASDLGLAKVDRGQVEQILLNLVVNARDAMSKGGRIILKTGNVLLDQIYLGTHLEAAPGPHVMLAVSDTGTGMTPEVKARLFEPFFTTKEPGKGTGLGLSVVYGIVKQSGGSISVYSEVGMGTVFRIYFPLAQQDTGIQPAFTSAERSEIHGGDETILVVEDSEPVRKFAALALEAQGYKVLQAGNGKEALRVLEESVPVQLVVTDLVMPDMGGVSLANRLRKRKPTIPVLFMSGYVEYPNIPKALLRSRESILQKPFSPFELCKKVREVLEGARKKAKTR